jgi:hypothetical protein
MVRNYEKCSNDHTWPSIIHANMALQAYATSRERDSVKEAEDFFAFIDDLSASGRMSLQPNAVTFNTLIGCYAKQSAFDGRSSKREENARAGDKVFRRLKQLYESTGDDRFKPDTRTYVNVLNAWASAGHPERAQSLVLQMYDDYAAGNEAAIPDVRCFTVVGQIPEGGGAHDSNDGNGQRPWIGGRQPQCGDFHHGDQQLRATVPYGERELQARGKCQGC